MKHPAELIENSQHWIAKWTAVARERAELRSTLEMRDAEVAVRDEKLAALEAENERLRQENASYRQDWLDSEETAAREVYRRGELEAENERLQAIIENTVNRGNEHLKAYWALQAENERMRAVLETVVADAKLMQGGVFWFSNLATLQSVRQALIHHQE